MTSVVSKDPQRKRAHRVPDPTEPLDICMGGVKRTVNLRGSLWEAIEQARGEQPRSAWVEAACLAYLKALEKNHVAHV